MNVEKQIRDYIGENFLLGSKLNIDSTQSLLAAGILDSTGVLELIGFIEQQFGIHVADEDVVPENMDTLENLARYIGSKLACPNHLRAGTTG